MREESLGSLTVRILGGSDGGGGGEGPAVILMHGFGAPGADLVPFAGEIAAPEGTRWIFPEAPLLLPPELGGGAGRAWWHIGVMRLQMAMMLGQTRDLTKEEPEGMAEARGKVDAMIDAVAEELSMMAGPPQPRISRSRFSSDSTSPMSSSVPAAMVSDPSRRARQKPAERIDVANVVTRAKLERLRRAPSPGVAVTALEELQRHLQRTYDRRKTEGGPFDHVRTRKPGLGPDIAELCERQAHILQRAESLTDARDSRRRALAPKGSVARPPRGRIPQLAATIGRSSWARPMHGLAVASLQPVRPRRPPP